MDATHHPAQPHWEIDVSIDNSSFLFVREPDTEFPKGVPVRAGGTTYEFDFEMKKVSESMLCRGGAERAERPASAAAPPPPSQVDPWDTALYAGGPEEPWREGSPQQARCRSVWKRPSDGGSQPLLRL